MEPINIEQEADVNDIDGTLQALRKAWYTCPEFTLSELIDTVTPMPFTEMTNSEFIQSLNEFIVQNK